MTEKEAYRRGFEHALRYCSWRRSVVDHAQLARGEEPTLYIGKDHGAETTTLQSAIDGIPNLYIYDPEMK